MMPMPTHPAPQGRLVTVVVEVDVDFLDDAAPTGLTTAGHIELREAIAQVGTVAMITRTPHAVPAPPVPPVTNEKTRAYSRRRLAHESAMVLADRSRVAHFVTDAKHVVADARTLEAYLNGETTEAAA